MHVEILRIVITKHFEEIRSSLIFAVTLYIKLLFIVASGLVIVLEIALISVVQTTLESIHFACLFSVLLIIRFYL